MSKQFRLPLSDEQRQYLLELVQRDQGDNRYHLNELLMHGDGMTTTLERDIETAEAHLSRATGMSELLQVLTSEANLPVELKATRQFVLICGYHGAVLTEEDGALTVRHPNPTATAVWQLDLSSVWCPRGNVIPADQKNNCQAHWFLGFQKEDGQ